MVDKIRERLEKSTLGTSSQEVRVAPNDEELNMFVRFLNIFGVRVSKIEERQVKQEAATGTGSGDETAKLFANSKNRKAN